MLCVWWDQKGVVYYKLLKPGETINTQRYQQQIIELDRELCKKRPEYADRHEDIIFQHDNEPSHTARLVRDTLDALGWELLPYPSYTPDLAYFDYHLFASKGHALANQHFNSYEDVKKWLDGWFLSKGDEFF